MAFAAMFRLSSVSPFDLAGALPPTGLLYFWCNVNNFAVWSPSTPERQRAVVWYIADESVPMRRVESPWSKEDAIREFGKPVGEWESDATGFRCRLTLPDCLEYSRNILDVLTGHRYERYLKMLDVQRKEICAGESHQLLGMPTVLQSRFHDPATDELLFAFDFGARGLGKHPNDGAGMLYYVIRRADLTARRFDRVWVETQTD